MEICAEIRRSPFRQLHLLENSRSTLRIEPDHGLCSTSKYKNCSIALSSKAKEIMNIKQMDLPSSRIISPKLSAHRSLCRPIAAKNQDAMCKDQVNTPRQQVASDGGVASVSFLGANGLEISVDCPKARFLPHFQLFSRQREKMNECGWPPRSAKCPEKFTAYYVTRERGKG